jgi:hypothetical protein
LANKSGEPNTEGEAENRAASSFNDSEVVIVLSDELPERSLLPVIIISSYPFDRAMAMEGYPKLSRLMAFYPEVAIFRRFGALNAENLLYLQAELQDLEIALQK